MVFKEPPPTIRWNKVEALLMACGVALRRGPGDGTFLEFGSVRAEVQTPEREVLAPTIRRTRNFLNDVGITPDKVRCFLA